MKHLRTGGGALLLLLLFGSSAGVSGQDATTKADVKKPFTTVAEDGEFLRRVMLDLVGYPPNLEQVKAFMADPSSKKRAAKIDELLAGEQYADYWTRRIMEVLFDDYHNVGFQEVRPELTGGAKQKIVKDFHAWLKLKIGKDKPWTEIIFEMLDAGGSTEGDPALAYKLSFYFGDGYKAETVSGVSRQLLGLRILCARCHDHPFDPQLTEQVYTNMEAFYDGQRLRTMKPSATEKDGNDKPRMLEAELKEANDGDRRMAQFLYGGKPDKYAKRSTALATFMTAKGTTQLPRAMVNRVWSWLFGRGIVHPVDDFNEVNKRRAGAHMSKMEQLTKDFIADKYSLKSLIRQICLMPIYQMTCEKDKSQTESKDEFVRHPVFQLNSEQLYNSIQVATKGSVSHNIEEARGIGKQLFAPGAVWCETTPLPGNARQALLMRNSGLTRGGSLARNIASGAGTVEEKVKEMFLAALSRLPNDTEVARYSAWIKAHDNNFEDAYWTILNTTEFVTRH